MTNAMAGELRRLMAPAMAAAILGSAAAGASCIIPDHGIVALVDCGVRWCSTAEYAKALDGDSNPVDVLEPQPDGSSDWVTECVCLTPDEDLVLRAEAPAMQYELLRNQVLDAARKACLDQAIANDLDPDPLPPEDASLEVTCTEAVTTIVRNGCCKLRNDLCGGTTQACDADLDPTDAEEPGPLAPVTGDAGESSESGLDSTGGDGGGAAPSLEPFYAEATCRGTTCTIGPALIDAIVRSPEAVLAEGTSLAFVSSQGVVLGMELRGVEAGNLAGRLGLRDGDVIVRVGELRLRDEAEVLAAVEWAASIDEVRVVLLRDGTQHERLFVRGQWGQ